MPRRRLPFRLTFAAALTFGCGVAASAGLFVAVSQLECDNLALAFEQRAAQRVAAVHQGLDEAVEVLNVTNQLFANGAAVTRTQFRDFTAPLLQRHPFIRAFNFHRVVADSERAQLEAQLQRVRPGAHFMERQHGVLAPAPRRPTYTVVDYLEPLAGNEPALGFNIATHPQVAPALDRAASSGEVVMTDLMQLVQDAAPQPSIELIAPVFASDGRLLGDTAVVLNARQLVRSALSAAGLWDDASVAMTVYAAGQPDPDRLVLTHGKALSGHAGQLAAWLVPNHPDRSSHVVDVGGRQWLVQVASAPRPFLADHIGSVSLLAGGLLVTLLLTAYVQGTAARARQIEQLVRDRTADLKRTNLRLVEDVIARRRAEKALQQSEQRFRQLVAMSSDWYWEQDAQFRFTSITGRFTEKTGVSLERLMGRARWDYVPGMADTEEGRAHIALVAAHQPFHGFEYQAEDDHGQTRWFSINGEPVFDDQGRFAGYRGTGSDITERKQAEQRVFHVAQHDVLTGLPNRSLLQDRLGQAVAHANRAGHPVWVMMIDLDRFKFVNDSMGHKAGDVLLVTVAARLRASLRDSDTVARLSGDEFVVILSQHQDQPLTTEVVQRVMESVARPVLLGAKEFMVTCSIGVAVYPGDGGSADSLIEHADIAMYSAKKLGRNNYQFYTPALNEESLERVRIEGALRNALDRQELVLHYQPQVDLASGQIVGMEALVRWNHPELGMIGPDRFIGVAEETGLIVQIGAWVMREAAARNKAWQDAGLGRLRVAVNLSARQFGDQGLLDSIAAVLADTGLPPACLELELTESLFMSGASSAVDLLHHMKALGVNLSIDDFGTGYSSLSYLSRFPIDVLKIDRSFVADITADANDAAIVSSIIALAHNLKLAVIAEGVETAEQLDYLRSQGCDEMQGYYFSRPLPAEAFEALLRERRALPALPLEAAACA